MMTDEYATQRDLDLLRQEVRENRTSLEVLKSANSNIAVLSTQLSQLTTSVSEMKTNFDARFNEHERVHEKDEKQRSSNRKFLITTCLTGLAIIAGLYGWIALLLHR